MKGTRPLTDAEIHKVSEAFGGMYEIRNRSLFLIGISTGGRISELLGLTVGDVWQNGSAVSDILFEKGIVKGKDQSRAVYVNSDGRGAIEKVLGWHRATYGEKVVGGRPLFPSRKGQGAYPMRRQSAHDILKAAFVSAGLNGKLATHSMRKSYAQRLYHRTRDLVMVQNMLGHKSVAVTQAYLGVDYQILRQASEGMSLFSEGVSDLLGTVADDTLLVELARRGYDISPIEKVKGDNRS